MVDVDKLQDIIDEVRLNLPTEVRQAKAIVNDRAEIVADAKREAESIIKKAEDRARVLVSEQEVVKAAQQRAAEIVSSAQTQARTMRTTVTDYCENMLRTTESSWPAARRRSRPCAPTCARAPKTADFSGAFPKYPSSGRERSFTALCVFRQNRAKNPAATPRISTSRILNFTGPSRIIE